jgi:hypothetical protein
MQLPTEIINHILSFRPTHPTAKMIESLYDKAEEEAYEAWGGNFPTGDEEEECELDMDYIRTRTLFQNLYDGNFFLARAPTLVYNSTTGKIYYDDDEDDFAVFNKRVVYDYNMEIHPLLD